MRKLNYRVAILAALLSFSSVTKADWGGWHMVHIAYTHHSGDYYFYHKATAEHINPDGCAVARPYKISADSVNAKEMYRTALTAIASGLKVSANVYGCLGSYPKITHLRIIR
ncbi:MAG: hypothetical protein AAF431_17590 [Pseudomonadota bacterium]